MKGSLAVVFSQLGRAARLDWVALARPVLHTADPDTDFAETLGAPMPQPGGFYLTANLPRVSHNYDSNSWIIICSFAGGLP
jgi:hypothetical protein